MKVYDVRIFESDCGKFSVQLAHDGALGAAHDHIMAVKGDIVERMVKAQKQEEDMMSAQKEDEKPEDAPIEEAPKEEINV